MSSVVEGPRALGARLPRAAGAWTCPIRLVERARQRRQARRLRRALSAAPTRRSSRANVTSLASICTQTSSHRTKARPRRRCLQWSRARVLLSTCSESAAQARSVPELCRRHQCASARRPRLVLARRRVERSYHTLRVGATAVRPAVGNGQRRCGQRACGQHPHRRGRASGAHSNALISRRWRTCRSSQRTRRRKCAPCCVRPFHSTHAAVHVCPDKNRHPSSYAAH